MVESTAVDFNDDFSLSFGNFSLTDRLARLKCSVEYDLLQECLGALCIDFNDACPIVDLDAPALDEILTCDNIDTIICHSFPDEDDGCCIRSCALELQELSICAGDLSLACKDPSCGLHEEHDLSCAKEGDRFFCNYYFNIDSDGSALKSAEVTIGCAYDETFGLDIFSSDCECESAILTGNTTLQVCGCSLCGENETALVALDCSMSPGGPFVVDDCTGQTCNGECIQGEISGNNTDILTTTTPSIVAESTTALPTMAPAILASPTSAPEDSAVDPSSIVPTSVPSSPSSTPKTEEPIVTTSDRINTTKPTMAIPEAQTSLEPTTAPTFLNGTSSIAPTIRNSSINFPTVIGPTSMPTGWLARGNITDAPINIDTEQLFNGTNATTAPSETSSSSKWYSNDMAITFGGAFLVTCFLLCIMVLFKGDMRGALWEEKRDNETGVNMFTL